MAVNNTLTGQRRLGLTAYLTQEAVRDQISKVVGGKDGQRFISAIISAVQQNPVLQECTNQSILSAALLGESLKLSPSAALGQYFLVPYNDRERGKVAQFQLGYKGYIQLAIRSGQYKKLNVLAIKEGELVRFDPLNEEIEVNLIQDEEVRENTPTAGYYAMFEYCNGFRKAIYWPKQKMVNHAKKYSPGYQRDLKAGTAYTFWSKDFDSMALKTMLRQLISKWGVMSTEFQTAFDSDMAVINPDGTKNYVEMEPEIVETPAPDPVPAPIMPEPQVPEPTIPEAKIEAKPEPKERKARTAAKTAAESLFG